MSEHEFKAGDRVRFLANTYGVPGGTEGVVMSATGALVCVRPDICTYDLNFYPREIEHAPTTSPTGQAPPRSPRARGRRGRLQSHLRLTIISANTPDAVYVVHDSAGHEILNCRADMWDDIKALIVPSCWAAMSVAIEKGDRDALLRLPDARG